MPKIQVKDHANLVRDLESNAIVDIDHDAYSRYVAQKRDRQQQKEQISLLEKRINNQEKTLNDIKEILQRLLDK